MTDAEKSLKKRVRVFSPRVVELLERVSKAHTAVIEAPSGYGKTTAGECLWSEISIKSYNLQEHSHLIQ
jgi:ATP/maltotriose-dependent transcriptional regulator MalT